MYIDPNVLSILLLILGCVAIVYLILVLKNLNEFLKNIKKLINDNSSSITTTVTKLPGVVDNVNDISDNIKDVTEVVTDTTADFLVAKESVKSNIEIVTDIINIIKSVISSK